MPDHSWPLDVLGNEVRKGSFLRLTLAAPALFFRVLEVTPAGTILGPDQSPLALQGSITLQAIMQVQYAPGAVIQDAVVVKEPEPAGPALVKQ